MSEITRDDYKEDKKVQEEILDTLKKLLEGQENESKKADEERKKREKTDKQKEKEAKEKKKKEEEKLAKKYGYKSTSEKVKEQKQKTSDSLNLKYAKKKHEALLSIGKKYGRNAANAAAVGIMAAESLAEGTAKGILALNKKAVKTAVATTKKAIKETAKYTAQGIDLASSTMKKSVNIATTAMKDPIEGLGTSIESMGDSMQSVGSKFGPIGKAIGGAFGGILDTFGKFETGALKEFSQLDHQVRQFQKSLGLDEVQTEQFRDTSIEAAKMVAKNWGKTYKDIAKAQSSLIEKSGRNLVLGSDDYNEYFGLSQVAGEENAIGLTAGLQEFNQDVASTSDMFFDMYKNAQKIGVSMEKSTKDVLNNLKLANKYNFKEGSKSIMDMAVWANKTKFNLASIGNVIDTVSGGGVESAITSSAQLQVLGGEFTNRSNPLGMLYESLEDPEALAKRVQAMAGEMGRFDVETGETKLTGSDIRRLQSAGKALGMSPEEMNVMAKESIRRKEVEKQLGNTGLSDEQRDLIASKAQYDKKTKQFYVTDLSGQKTYAKDINTSNISNFDLSPDVSNEEKLVDYAGKTFSQVDEIAKVVAGKSIKDIEMGKQQQETFDTLIDTTKQTMDVVYDSLGSVMRDISKQLTPIISDFMPLITETMAAISPMIPKVIELFKPILSMLSDTIIPMFIKLSDPMIKMANEIVPLVGKVVEAVAPLAETFMNNVTPILSSIADAVLPIVDKIVPIVDNILKSVAPIVDKLFEALQPIIDGIIPVISEILNQFYPIVSTIVDALAPIFKVISDEVLPYLKEYFAKIGPSINNFMGLIGRTLGNLFNAIAPSLGRITSVLGDVLAGLLDVLAPIISVISDTLATFLTPILEILTPILEVLISILKPIIDVISPLLKGISNIINFTTDIITKIYSFIRTGIDWIVDGIRKGVEVLLYPFKWIADKFENITSFLNIDDGIVTENGVIKTNPKDEIVAAKSGGPFDLLFNDMYDKISDVYDKTDERNALNKTIVENSNVTNNSKPMIVGVQPIGANSSVVNVDNGRMIVKNNNNNTSNSGNVNVSPINININGKLDLVSDGASVDIIGLLKSNPMFARKITEMVIEQISSNINGGKTKLFNNRYTI